MPVSQALDILDMQGTQDMLGIHMQVGIPDVACSNIHDVDIYVLAHSAEQDVHCDVVVVLPLHDMSHVFALHELYSLPMPEH